MFSKLLRFAEAFDALRVVPRLLMVGYCFFVVRVVTEILHWYFLLPAAERTIEVSGMATLIVTAVTGMSKFMYEIYVQGGRQWSNEESE